MAKAKETVKSRSATGARGRTKSGGTRITYPLVLLVLVIIGEIAFGINPKADRITWALENIPVWIMVPLLVRLQPKLQLTNLTLSVLAFHALVLMLGGHYTYAKVPVGFWVRDFLELGRNHYDRLGHIMQGLGPAVGLRELLLKRTILKRGWFTNIIIVSMCLAFSAFYEMIEWWSALIMGEGADDFLGTQGDVWDTQWDMFLALVGAAVAVLLIAPWQDRQMKKP